MTILRIAAVLLLASTAAALQAQKAAVAAAPARSSDPLIVDLHAAPYRASIDYTVNISQQRFDMRNATIVNLIDFAHGRPDDDGREDNAIVGGPTWIDLNRFDLVAMIPALKPESANAQPGSGPSREDRYAKIEPVVERILAERFHLKYHVEDRPLPGYTLTVAKDGSKLAGAKDPSAPSGCRGARDQANPEQMDVTCTSESIAQLLAIISGSFRHPILDRTGLTKSYDFTLRVFPKQMQTREDTIHAYIDVFNKQLGLLIVPGLIPQPAIVVDAVDRAPTPNPPDTAKRISTIPDLEFEVATIKPAPDDAPERSIRLAGSQITFSGFTMQELLTRAWEFPTGAMLGNRPDWLVRTRYTLQMKLPDGVDARTLSQNSQLFDEMLRKLLTERFQMKDHWGEQTVTDAYVLLPGTPKMKKADPAARSFCKYGPPEGEKDVRTAQSAFDAEFHCQNVTMDQFADLAQPMAASEIKYRVPNKTGLAGAWDFTVYYTTGHKMRLDAMAAQAAAKQAGEPASASTDPTAGLPIEEAFRKQLGLKLEHQSSAYPALILDHIEETPTEN